MHVFLFLKWLRKLTVIDESNGQPVIIENLGEEGGFIRLKKNKAEQRFVIERRSATVPLEVAADPVLVFYKRQNVTRREVVIAFAVDEDGNLQPVEDASALGTVSSFLPLVEERSGAKFLIQASNHVFMGMGYSPSEDWERTEKYSPQLAFLSPDYLLGVLPADIAGWKDFFSKVGVKDSGERNHVESFAMVFVENRLCGELSAFVPTNRQQVGYDREARRERDGALVKLEIKGQKKDQPVQLVGNEPEAAKAAHRNGEAFWVCIVSGIPEEPQLWIVEDALSAGSFDTLKIDVSQWKAHGRRVT